MRSDVAADHAASTDDAAFADGHALMNYRAATDKAVGADHDTAVKPCAGRDMAVRADSRIMFDQCHGIDDAVLAYQRGGVDERAVQYHRTKTELRMTGNVGVRRHHDWNLRTQIEEFSVQVLAQGCARQLADGNQCTRRLAQQVGQCIVITPYRVAQDGRKAIAGRLNDASHLKMRTAFYDVDHRAAMAAATDQQNRSRAHARKALLGRLMMRAAKACATGKGALGLPTIEAIVDIRFQQGRVM